MNKIIGVGFIICVCIFFVCWIIHVLLVLKMQWKVLKGWNKVKLREAIKDGLDTKYYQWDKNILSFINKMFLTIVGLIILIIIVELILKIIA